jgi:rod shape-determining protein MreB
MFTRRIGIDLGTSNTIVTVPKRGIVTSEPSVVAISLDENKILAVGQAAKEMLGKTPDMIRAACPLKDGVIADFRVTEALLFYFIQKAGGALRIFRPETLISIPAGITSTERRAVIDAALEAGAKTAYLVKKPVLAAIGAGIPINSPAGNIIIDIGGGTAEIAVISLGGIVSAHSARVGGNKLDEAIINYIRKKYMLAIGTQTAERAKIKLGSAILQSKEDEMEIRGRDLSTGLPKIIKIHSNEITEALQDRLREIIQAIKKVLQETPPELAADIIDRGMILTGGSAELKNLDNLLAKAVGVPCYVADDPSLCVVKGIKTVLENLDTYKRSLIS